MLFRCKIRRYKGDFQKYKGARLTVIVCKTVNARRGDNQDSDNFYKSKIMKNSFIFYNEKLNSKDDGLHTGYTQAHADFDNNIRRFVGKFRKFVFIRRFFYNRINDFEILITIFLYHYQIDHYKNFIARSSNL